MAGALPRPVALRSGDARIPIHRRPHHGGAKLAYTALLYQDLLRTNSGPLPPVLPVVLHHGRERWTAPEDVAGLAASAGEFLAPYQPAQRYFLLDVGGYTGSLPEGRNLAGLIRLEHGRSPADVEVVLAALAQWLSGPEHQGLRRAFVEWIRQVHAPARRSGMEWLVLEDLSEDRTMLYETVKEWTVQWQAEGRADVMRRLAARKFGAVTADRLAEELERVHDPRAGGRGRGVAHRVRERRGVARPGEAHEHDRGPAGRRGRRRYRASMNPPSM